MPTPHSPLNPASCLQSIIRLVTLIGLCALLGACTNSKIVLSTLYNRLDDQIRGEFNKLGKFDEAQKQAFEKRLQTFHYWHRRQELPRYADLIRDIRAQIIKPANAGPADIERWLAEIEAAVDDFQSCYPAHFSIDLMRSLKAAEIDFIEKRFTRERQKNLKAYHAKTREQRMNERLANVDKWLGRAGFDMTRRQKSLLLGTMYQTISLHDEYYVLTRQWNKTLFATMRKPEASDYQERMQKLLGHVFRLVEIHHPDKVETNRRIWRRFAEDFTASLTGAQRDWIDSYFARLAINLDRLATSRVRHFVQSESALGCLPDTGS